MRRGLLHSFPPSLSHGYMHTPYCLRHRRPVKALRTVAASMLRVYPAGGMLPLAAAAKRIPTTMV
mgnify:CR=1 FL=1